MERLGCGVREDVMHVELGALRMGASDGRRAGDRARGRARVQHVGHAGVGPTTSNHFQTRPTPPTRPHVTSAPPARRVARVAPPPWRGRVLIPALSYPTPTAIAHPLLSLLMATTLLAQMRTALVVDVDSMDPDVAARHTSATERFCDMTSNQAIVYSESIRPERLPLFKEAVQKARASGEDLDEQRIVDDAVDLFVRRLAQTSPLSILIDSPLDRPPREGCLPAPHRPRPRPDIPCGCLRYRGDHRPRKTPRFRL